MCRVYDRLGTGQTPVCLRNKTAGEALDSPDIGMEDRKKTGLSCQRALNIPKEDMRAAIGPVILPDQRKELWG